MQMIVGFSQNFEKMLLEIYTGINLGFTKMNTRVSISAFVRCRILNNQPLHQ